MQPLLALAAVIAGPLVTRPEPPPGFWFDAGALRIGLNGSGYVVSLQDTLSGRELLPPGMTPTLLSLTVNGEPVRPVAATYDPAAGLLNLSFGEGVVVRVAVAVKPTHTTFRPKALTGAKLRFVLGVEPKGETAISQ